MQNNTDKRSGQPENQPQPGEMNSFNQRDQKRSADTEGAVKEKKDEKNCKQRRKKKFSIFWTCNKRNIFKLLTS